MRKFTNHVTSICRHPHPRPENAEKFQGLNNRADRQFWVWFLYFLVSAALAGWPTKPRDQSSTASHVYPTTLCLAPGALLCDRFRRRRPFATDQMSNRVIERALEAMRQLNRENGSGRGQAAGTSATSGWGRTTSQKPKNKQMSGSGVIPTRPLGSPALKAPKRSRLPAAAVKEMRLVCCACAWQSARLGPRLAAAVAVVACRCGVLCCCFGMGSQRPLLRMALYPAL